MADRVFAIDFGSAFTKVALRRDPGADAELLAPPAARADDAAFCIPSLAVVDRTAARLIPEFGDAAATRRPGNGIDVYTNWKRWVFTNPEGTGKTQPPAIEMFLQAQDVRQLAAKYGVTAGQLAQLHQLVVTARTLTGGPGGRVVSPEAQQHTFAAALAVHFFRWLRGVVLGACNRLKTTGLDFERIPARLSVPAFALGGDPHPGTRLLTTALEKAGWPLHPQRPVVSEPYSNAIGILTKGHNAVQRTRLHLGQMFGKGPLITALRDPEHHPAYRAVVADVGAFTTDFAAVTIRPNGETVDNPDLAFTAAERSVPLGVSDLDARFVAALPKEKGDWLREKAGPPDWEDVRRAVYADGKGFRTPEAGVIGGPTGVGAVRDSLDGFTRDLAAEAKRFCADLEPVGLQELILTGGGNAIPVVRDALQEAAQSAGLTFAKTHAPGLKRTPGGPPTVKLDAEFTRGGSALGGASLYFERDFY